MTIKQNNREIYHKFIELLPNINSVQTEKNFYLNKATIKYYKNSFAIQLKFESLDCKNSAIPKLRST